MATKRRRGGRRRRRRGNLKVIVVLFLVVLIAGTVLCLSEFGIFQKNKFEIRRTYNEIILRTDKDPGNISGETFEAKYPEFLMKDIESLRKTINKQMIRYHNNSFNSYISIDEDKDGKLQVKIAGLREKEDNGESIVISEKFQLYHLGKDVVIYGIPKGERSLIRYSISDNKITEREVGYVNFVENVDENKENEEIEPTENVVSPKASEEYEPEEEYESEESGPDVEIIGSRSVKDYELIPTELDDGTYIWYIRTNYLLADGSTTYTDELVEDLKPEDSRNVDPDVFENSHLITEDLDEIYQYLENIRELYLFPED